MGSLRTTHWARTVGYSTYSPRPLAVRAHALPSGSSRHKAAQAQNAQDQQGLLAPSRRELLLGAVNVTLLQSIFTPSDAQAASGLSRYIKKKTLDPLETYVPLVLEAQEQLLALRGTVAADPARAREQLRVGAFSALRDNVRALGEYAQQSGAVKDAGVLVNGFFRKLEAFDLLLYRVVKDQAELDGEEAEGKLLEAADALADLIATVPADVLERSRKVLDKVQGRSSSEQVAGGEAPAVAPEAKQLSPEDVELLNELLTVWE